MAYSQAAWERAMRMLDVILQAINGGSRTDPAESHAATGTPASFGCVHPRLEKVRRAPRRVTIGFVLRQRPS